MNDLKELIVSVKKGDISFDENHEDFGEILELIDRAEGQGLLKNVVRTLSKRRDGLYGRCIAVTIKDGLTASGEMWLKQHGNGA